MENFLFSKGMPIPAIMHPLREPQLGGLSIKFLFEEKGPLRFVSILFILIFSSELTWIASGGSWSGKAGCGRESSRLWIHDSLFEGVRKGSVNPIRFRFWGANKGMVNSKPWIYTSFLRRQKGKCKRRSRRGSSSWIREGAAWQEIIRIFFQAYI